MKGLNFETACARPFCHWGSYATPGRASEQPMKDLALEFILHYSKQRASADLTPVLCDTPALEHMVYTMVLVLLYKVQPQCSGFDSACAGSCDYADGSE